MSWEKDPITHVINYIQESKDPISGIYNNIECKLHVYHDNYDEDSDEDSDEVREIGDLTKSALKT